MTPDSDGLHRIANTEKPDRQADIVFIHGLMGTSHGTWRHGEEGKQDHFFWPEELGKELPSCGIWSVGYPAGLAKLKNPGMIIGDRAGNISLKLANASVGDRPLCFVTHSMGGLIVKSLIVRSQTLDDTDRKRIVNNVCGIVFCGTPHRGSEFADAAVRLGKYFGGSQGHVGEMRSNAADLDILHDEFIAWHSKHPTPVESYAENKRLFYRHWLLRWLPIGRIVPRSSANPNIAGYSVYRVDEDHLTLVKPPNREHDVYAGVLRFIRKILAAKPAPRASVSVHPPAAETTRAQWFLPHRYLMPPNFTGRAEELDMLTRWLNEDTTHPMLVLLALGGFGKSALAWHWLMHEVAPGAWPRVVWWSFYEGDASFDHFLAEMLNYLGVPQADQQALSPHDQVEKLLQLLHVPGTLMVLDGFERALRAYGGLNAAYQGDEVTKSEANDRDCISPLAERFLRGIATLPEIHAKVLLTTRLCPRVLEARGGGLLQGCQEEELLQMQPADAVAFFRAHDIQGTDTEIKQACAPCGYHPLSLCLLAGLIVEDLQQPGDIAATTRLELSGDVIACQFHVLEAAYDGLAPDRQALLSRIACFRGPVKYDALKALAETAEESSTALDADLRDLVVRGLLHHDTREGRFDLHPIVRRFAYDQMAAPDRAAAHTSLRDYFAGVPPPDKMMCLEDLAPVIELFHHTVRAGQFDDAFRLLRNRLVPNPLHFQFGAYQLMIELKLALFPEGEDYLPRLEDESAQTWLLHALANSYSLNGQPRRAVPLFEASKDIDEKRGDRAGVAFSLGSLADDQLKIGALRAAETNLSSTVAIFKEIKRELDESVEHGELGRLLAYRGAYDESDMELRSALEMAEKQDELQMSGVICGYLALRVLLQLRSDSHSEFSIPDSALELAQRTLDLADKTASIAHPVERDYVRAHWLIGSAHRVAGHSDEAGRHLLEALERCRSINAVDIEADILIDLARLRTATGTPADALRPAEEALLITERSGYVLQGADAHLELAKLAIARGDKATAKEHAQQAKDLATCDGPPDYTYKAAYDEACALLDKLK